MTTVEATPNSIDAIVARAEEFMRSGLIKGIQCGPAPRREGTGRNCGKWRAFEWICKHVSYDEKKCLFWPFSKNYGHPALVGYRGKTYKPARLMCLLANGHERTFHNRPFPEAHQSGTWVHACALQ